MPFYHRDQSSDDSSFNCPFLSVPAPVIEAPSNPDNFTHSQRVEFSKLSEYLEHLSFVAHLVGLHIDASLSVYKRVKDDEESYSIAISVHSSHLHSQVLTCAYPPVTLYVSYSQRVSDFSFQRVRDIYLDLFSDFHAACDYVRKGDLSPTMNGFKVGNTYPGSRGGHFFRKSLGTPRWS